MHALAPVKSLSVRAEVTLLSGFGALAFCLAALMFGKDLHFDALHYHLYLGASADGSRLSRDFMAASLQSYLTPYGYVPFHWMAKHGWPTWLALTSIALVQSLIVPATWLVSYAIFPGRSCGDSVSRVMSVVMGLACGLIIVQIGSSFIDLTTSIPVIAGLAIMLLCHRGMMAWTPGMVASGLVFGIATGLKLTNAQAVVCAFFIPVLSRGTLVQRFSRLSIAGLVSGFAFALVQGPWSVQLWKEFGNPMFPFFNAIFKSDDFGLWSFRHVRFEPDGPMQFILRPLLVADFMGSVYHESSAPDARFAGLLGLLTIIACKRFKGSPLAPRLAPCAAMLMIWLCAGWVTWLLWSGNGRYFIPGFVLVGPMIMASVRSVSMAGSARLAWGGFVVIFAAQLGLLMTNTATRWSNVERPFTGLSDRFFDVLASGPLATEPRILITIGMQSSSWSVTGLHRDSSLINIDGQYTMRPGGPGWDRVKGILDSARPIGLYVRSTPSELRNIASARGIRARNPQEVIDRLESAWMLANFRKTLLFYGMAPKDNGRCWRLSYNQKDPVEHERFYMGEAVNTGLEEPIGMVCDVITIAATETQPRSTEIERADLAASIIERHCPERFPPGQAVTVPRESAMTRFYSPTDTRMVFNSLGEVSSSTFLVFGMQRIGLVEEIISGQWTPNCMSRQTAYVPPWAR
jgi:hypothetical protein